MQATIEDVSKLPEALRGEYEQVNGKWVLKIEGEHPTIAGLNSKISEFRETNIAVMKKRDELDASLRKFDGVDPAEYKSLRERVTKFEKDGGVKDPSDIDARIKAATEPLQQEIAGFRQREAEAKQQLASKEREGRLRDIASKAGVADTAVPDFVFRGSQVFDLDGTPKKGGQTLYGKGGAALSMEEWAQQLATEAPHLFKSNKGGGAAGSGERGSGGGKSISGVDPLEFGYNLEDIAKGKVTVSR